MKLKIKPQRGVTYECYISYTDERGSRVRKGQRFYLYGVHGENYAMLAPSHKGDIKLIDKKEFVSHFCPVNPLNCCDE
jgi:hypothetical protein